MSDVEKAKASFSSTSQGVSREKTYSSGETEAKGIITAQITDPIEAKEMETTPAILWDPIAL